MSHPTEHRPESAPAAIAAWSGELLWPRPVPTGAIVDLSAVEALGVWAHAWFRARPGTAVVGGAAFRPRLERAGVPVRWCASIAEAMATPDGVSRGEREMLWG
jgi:hypothetical protein